MTLLLLLLLLRLLSLGRPCALPCTARCGLAGGREGGQGRKQGCFALLLLTLSAETRETKQRKKTRVRREIRVRMESMEGLARGRTGARRLSARTGRAAWEAAGLGPRGVDNDVRAPCAAGYYGCACLSVLCIICHYNCCHSAGGCSLAYHEVRGGASVSRASLATSERDQLPNQALTTPPASQADGPH